MDFKDKNTFFKMFIVAFRGMCHAVKTEKNIRIQLVCTATVIFFACFFHVSNVEWMILLLCIGGVLSLELLNTAIERVVDLAANQSYHALAKQAKDVAAAAVLLFSIFACVIACFIFIPKVYSFF